MCQLLFCLYVLFIVGAFTIAGKNDGGFTLILIVWLAVTAIQVCMVVFSLILMCALSDEEAAVELEAQRALMSPNHEGGDGVALYHQMLPEGAAMDRIS